jgi:hypothetical protein
VGIGKECFQIWRRWSNDNTVDDSSLLRSSQSKKEDHTTMLLTRKS